MHARIMALLAIVGTAATAFGAGTHAIPLPAGLSPGVYLVRVRGATIDATIRARVQ